VQGGLISNRSGEKRFVWLAVSHGEAGEPIPVRVEEAFDADCISILMSGMQFAFHVYSLFVNREEVIQPKLYSAVYLSPSVCNWHALACAMLISGKP